ncbi:MAG: hypothetical protein CSA58_10445 [Micrococcales bacterium]|nr:MAG: hypothetical protein CSA58_10445 [Micrococcales bacterium]
MTGSVGRAAISAAVVVPLVLGGAWWSAGRMQAQLDGHARTRLDAARHRDVQVRFDGRDAVVRPRPGAEVTDADLDEAAAVVAEMGGTRAVSVDRESAVAVSSSPKSTPSPTETAPAAAESGSPDVPPTAPPVPPPAGVVQFEFGEAGVPARAEELVAAVAAYLQANPGISVRVVGYTDPFGTEARNRTVSRQRADVVARALAERGIDEDRITAEGRSYREPVAPNDTEAGRAANRRVEFEFEGG